MVATDWYPFRADPFAPLPVILSGEVGLVPFSGPTSVVVFEGLLLPPGAKITYDEVVVKETHESPRHLSPRPVARYIRAEGGAAQSDAFEGRFAPLRLCGDPLVPFSSSPPLR